MAGMQRSGRRRMGGVTLVEQVMVLAIVAILVGVASPPLAGLMRRERVRSAQMDFLAALAYARTQAVLRGKRVLFCPTRDRMRCSDESRWDGGWLVGADRDHDNQPDAAPMRVGNAYAHVRIRSSASRKHVTFLPDGSAGGSNLTLHFCAPGDGGQPLGVVVSNAGRIRGSHPKGKKAAECT